MAECTAGPTILCSAGENDQEVKTSGSTETAPAELPVKADPENPSSPYVECSKEGEVAVAVASDTKGEANSAECPQQQLRSANGDETRTDLEGNNELTQKEAAAAPAAASAEPDSSQRAQEPGGSPASKEWVAKAREDVRVEHATRLADPEPGKQADRRQQEPKIEGSVMMRRERCGGCC